MPDPNTSCGPYTPKRLMETNLLKSHPYGVSGNHDTIGMVAIDSNGKVAAGTSTNGASFKIPGWVCS